MELFWEEVPELKGKKIKTVRYTTLGTTLGESLVVILCTDGTLLRLKCNDVGCEFDELVIGSLDPDLVEDGEEDK